MAYMALNNEQARDYEWVKVAILDPVGLSSEEYYQKFQGTRWTGGMQAWAFTQKLMD